MDLIPAHLSPKELVEHLCAVHSLTRDSLADILGIHRQTLYRWIWASSPAIATLAHKRLPGWLLTQPLQTISLCTQTLPLDQRIPVLNALSQFLAQALDLEPGQSLTLEIRKTAGGASVHFPPADPAFSEWR